MQYRALMYATMLAHLFELAARRQYLYTMVIMSPCKGEKADDEMEADELWE